MPCFDTLWNSCLKQFVHILFGGYMVYGKILSKNLELLKPKPTEEKNCLQLSRKLS